LILPGARGAAPADGYLLKRGVQDPNQAYYNAAILPGWQKFKPNYRLGEIVTIHDDETCDVLLDDMRSSAQNLGINQAGTLLNVPIQYMTCSRAAFKETDRVVVRFNLQAWDDPIVVGFESNPAGCTGVVMKPGDSTGFPVGKVLYIDKEPPEGPTYGPYGGFSDSIQYGPTFENSTTEERVFTTWAWDSGLYYNVTVWHKNIPVHITQVYNVIHHTVFMTVSNRILLINANGDVYSFGPDYNGQNPWDSNNPNGWWFVGATGEPNATVFVQPDGEEFYIFGLNQYKRYSVADHGFSMTLEETVVHTDWPTTSMVGTLSNVVGVFWQGTAGNWTSQLVTVTTTGIFRDDPSYDDYENWEFDTVVAAGSVYNDTTFHSNFIRTVTETGPLSSISQVNDSYTCKSVVIYGRSNFYTESLEVNGTVSRTTSSSPGGGTVDAYGMDSTIKSSVGYLNGSAINSPESQTLTHYDLGNDEGYVHDPRVWIKFNNWTYSMQEYGSGFYHRKMDTAGWSALVASQRDAFYFAEPFVEYNRGLIFPNRLHSLWKNMPDDIYQYNWGPWSSENGFLDSLFGLDGQKSTNRSGFIILV